MSVSFSIQPHIAPDDFDYDSLPKIPEVSLSNDNTKALFGTLEIPFNPEDMIGQIDPEFLVAACKEALKKQARRRLGTVSGGREGGRGMLIEKAYSPERQREDIESLKQIAEIALQNSLIVTYA